MENTCFYCQKPATWVCHCRIPYTLLCDEDKQKHEQTTGSHSFLAFPLLTNPNSKSTFISKLDELITTNLDQQEKIIKRSEAEFIAFYDSVNLLFISFKEYQIQKLKILESQRKNLQTLKEKIENLDRLPVHSFFSPLERALLDEDCMKDLVSEISADRVEFRMRSPEEVISIAPSNIFHIISNYNFLFDLQEDLIRVKRKNKDMSKIEANISKTSSFLKVSNHSVLITGGKDSEKLAFELDINNNNILQMPILEEARISHSMAWIDEKPAVLGGNNGVKTLNSVEVLEGNEWVIRNERMVHARKNFSVLSQSGLVFVAGGGVNLEVYMNQTWNEIFVELIPDIISLCYYSDRLIIFGGKECKCVVLDLDRKTGEIGKMNQHFTGDISRDFKAGVRNFNFFDTRQDHIIKLSIML